jgi:hypothetical protein
MEMAAMAIDLEKLPARLRHNEATEYLAAKYNVAVRKSTLATMVTRGGGPSFQKFGQSVLYPVDELDRWVEARFSPVIKSTAELSRF